MGVPVLSPSFATGLAARAVALTAPGWLTALLAVFPASLAFVVVLTSDIRTSLVPVL